MIIAPVGLGLRQAYGKMLVGVGGACLQEVQESKSNENN